MSINHAHLPSISQAQLPARYEAAKLALRECQHIDECKDWADKSSALASYAKQSQDMEMEKTAMRIRARAVRRCGELLKEIEKATGNQHTRDKVLKGDASPKQTRGQAANEAGLSPDQAKQSIRVANVPEDEFDEQVDSDKSIALIPIANLEDEELLQRAAEFDRQSDGLRAHAREIRRYVKARKNSAVLA